MAKFASTQLSEELIKAYNVHSMPIRKGDSVVVARGAFRDVEGKVTKIDRKKVVIYVEGITKEKSNGNTSFLPIHPSKVMITKLILDDDRRKDILERRAKPPTEEEVEKPKTRTRKTVKARRKSSTRKRVSKETKTERNDSE